MGSGYGWVGAALSLYEGDGKHKTKGREINPKLEVLERNQIALRSFAGQEAKSDKHIRVGRGRRQARHFSFRAGIRSQKDNTLIDTFPNP